MGTAIRKTGAGTFEVDFAALQVATRRGLGRLWHGWRRATAAAEPVEVDPFLVAQAVRAVMRLCEIRSAHGDPLVWNRFKVFLSQADHRGLQPLQRRLEAGLESVVETTLEELRAETLGELEVQLLVDEQIEIRRGSAQIEALHQETLPPLDGEDPSVITTRIPLRRKRRPQVPTQRLQEPLVADTLRLSWPGHSAYVAPGKKVELGRPHPEAPQPFIALTGANLRINRRHLSIENQADGVVVTRLTEANPVQVAGRLIQPGGRFHVRDLPATLSLSNGELEVRLERVAGP